MEQLLTGTSARGYVFQIGEMHRLYIVGITILRLSGKSVSSYSRVLKLAEKHY